jgi:uncharacterized protein (TIGR03435 family)
MSDTETSTSEEPGAENGTPGSVRGRSGNRPSYRDIAVRRLVAATAALGNINPADGLTPAYVNRPAIDASGLEGGWDFALPWTPRANFDGAATNQPGAAAGASEPNGGLSLFEGVERLGLKLELRKSPYPVLVIDHIEQKPVED